MIKIALAQLEKQNLYLKGTEPAELLEIAPGEMLSVTSPVRYDLTAQLISGGVRVTGSASVSIESECGRCLKPVKREVKNPAIDLYFESPEGEELDITEDVRAELLVEFPMLLLCREECRGLCPRCGADLNERNCGCSAKPDEGPSPWDALRSLRPKK